VLDDWAITRRQPSQEGAFMRKAYVGWPLVQIAANMLRGRYTMEMGRKLATRLRERTSAAKFEDPMPWLRKMSTDLGAYCHSFDAILWEEAEAESVKIEALAKKKLDTLDFDLGGGANTPLLYFLVRKLKPQTVLETGVAAGFSSQAVLYALRLNGEGRLFSSDLPYFRINDPEKYIGFVVDNDLRANWTCLIRGDKTNLPRIFSEIDSIDIFHYDSDKSYAGREWAMNLILPRMKKGGAVIMDDLNDNRYFEKFTQSMGVDAHVFEFKGKYVGLFFVT
jgi:predicted O-methyltransferase YrrM